MATDLFQEALLDHYKNPRNNGTLESPDFSCGEANPSCGDSILMQGHIEDDTLTDIRFTGQGCVLNQATASMLTEEVIGKSLDEILALNTAYIENLVGSKLGPNRLRCALLPLQALQNGIKTYKEKKEQSSA